MRGAPVAGTMSRPVRAYLDMERRRLTPIVATVDDTADPASVLDVLALGRFVAGTEPVARSLHVNRVRPEALLLPPGCVASRTVVESGRRCHLVEGEGWTLSVTRWSDRSARLSVTARTEELARRVLDDASAGAVEEVDDDDSRVVVGFWHLQRCGTARRSERPITVESWASIRRNYAAGAAAALERVMAFGPADVSAGLLLLHGPAGTGKTTALRSLAHAWASWCRMEIVIDPERLLGDPGYLLRVTLKDADGDTSDDDDTSPRWRLIVLEDCDELIRAGAKKEAGQAVARLLNLTDGILGQGLSVLVAITTNEPIQQLHPAVVRPGRCLAEIEVGPLSHREACRWLGSTAGVQADGATLAELLALRGGLAKVEERPVSVSAGQYL